MGRDLAHETAYFSLAVTKILSVAKLEPSISELCLSTRPQLRLKRLEQNTNTVSNCSRPHP